MTILTINAKAQPRMYKSTSASMQRGAAIHAGRNDYKPTREQFIARARTIITKSELCHFHCGVTTKDSMLGKLRPVVTTMAQSGFHKPRDVARY